MHALDWHVATTAVGGLAVTVGMLCHCFIDTHVSQLIWCAAFCSESVRQSRQPQAMQAQLMGIRCLASLAQSVPTTLHHAVLIAGALVLVADYARLEDAKGNEVAIPREVGEAGAAEHVRMGPVMLL